ASRLIDANPADGRVVLDVGNVVGVRPGGNPHRWYSPSDVDRVVAALVEDLGRLDPSSARQYRTQAQGFETSGLAAYHAAIADIRRRFSGTSVGASESIFSMLAPALGLNLVTPP